jgi:type IV pilus assembly protein PilA
MLASLRKRIDKEEEGFTLIELLVVIIIIGILAAIAIPVFLSQRTKGYEASMKSDLRTVASQIESANVDAQSYLLVDWGAAAAAVTTMAAGSTATGSFYLGYPATTDKVTLSTGNTVTVKSVTATAYCIDATTSKNAASHWKYDSANGGVQTGTCP